MLDGWFEEEGKNKFMLFMMKRRRKMSSAWLICDGEEKNESAMFAFEFQNENKNSNTKGEELTANHIT